MKTLLTIAITVLITIATITARPYNGVNKGIAWDLGGVEIVGTPGLFLCESHNGFHNPLADLFPSLVVDC